MHGSSVRRGGESVAQCEAKRHPPKLWFESRRISHAHITCIQQQHSRTSGVSLDEPCVQQCAIPPPVSWPHVVDARRSCIAHCCVRFNSSSVWILSAGGGGWREGSWQREEESLRNLDVLCKYSRIGTLHQTPLTREREMCRPAATNTHIHTGPGFVVVREHHQGRKYTPTNLPTTTFFIWQQEETPQQRVPERYSKRLSHASRERGQCRFLT